MDNANNEAILLRFPPCLRKNIQEIWCDGKIGISGMNISLAPFPNRRILEDYSEPYSNKLLLKVPYAGRLLEWEVIFNEEDLRFAPDFDFRDDFLIDPNLELLVNNIPGLARWDLHNPKALITVLKEFISFYRKIQIKKLQTDTAFDKLHEEYRLLVDSEIGEENVEVNIDSSQAVTFLVLITVDFSSLPPYVQPMYVENGIESQKFLNCGDDTALLKIHFQKPEGGRTTVQLQLSPRLEQVLGDYSELHIPPYNRENQLVEYVNEVVQLLKQRVKDIETHHRLKNEYISTLLSIHPGNIVEYDSCKFSKATLLCEVAGYYCLVYISIGSKFPAEKPTVMLRSVCNLNYKKPSSVTLNSYAYSPRWKPEEMVTRLFKELADVIPKFKQQYNI